MLEKLKNIYQEYPSKFWVLVAIGFIDQVGGTMLFPFFALYITAHFNIGMTEAGLILSIYSITGLIGNMVGGALTDKYGRKLIMLFGLIFSALSSLSLGLVNNLSYFYALVVVVGLLSSIGEPANQAMIADILPEKQRNTGFGIMRVVGNLTWIIGPSIGGLIQTRANSYLPLFIIDSVISLITAAIAFRFIQETRPKHGEKAIQQSFGRTIAGYWEVLKNKVYLAFILVSILMLLVYTQMYSTLSVFMRDHHTPSFNSQEYGMLLSISAVLVILAQFSISKKVKDSPPMLVMALGAFFYMIGFTMFGFVKPLWLFVVAILIITVGEMIVVPTGQALATLFAPPDMRGRYMATYSLAWTVPQIIGPIAAGVVLDNYNPNAVWYIGGGLLFLSILGFMLLHRYVPRSSAPE